MQPFPTLSPGTKPEKLGKGGAAALALPGIIIAIAVSLPFLNSAYRMDDPYFLLLAQHVRVDPLHPLHFEMCWFSSPLYACGPASQLAPGAPLMGYFLLPLTLMGYKEPIAHLMQLALLCLAISATVRLALHFGLTQTQARIAGLLLATTPLALWSANTVLPDLLAMTLGVCGVERFVAWIERKGMLSGFAAAAALGLAPLARAHLLLLIGVAGLAAARYMWSGESLRATRFRDFGPLIGAVAIFVLLTAITRDQGTNGVLPPAGNLGSGNVLRNSRAFFLYCVFPFPIAFVWTIANRASILRTSVLSAIAAAGLIWQLLIKSAPQSLLTSAAVLGFICVAHLLLSAWQSREWRIVMLASWLLIPLAALPYMQFPPKFLLPSSPSIAILMSLMFQEERTWFRNSGLLIVLGVCLTTAILILRADVRFAELPRKAAANLIAPHVKRGERVWFTGEWGLYWYAQRAGAVLVTNVSKPQPGDLIIVGKQESNNGVINEFRQRALVEEKIFAWRGGRVMSAGGMARLYGTGQLAWSWESGEVNRYQVWRLE